MSNHPPIATEILTTNIFHNSTLKDEYAWLRAQNWPKEVKETKILDYLREENNFYNQFIQEQQTEKNEFFAELKNRVELKDVSVPIKRGNYYYYSRIEETQNYRVYCRKKDSMDSIHEEIILDINQLAIGKDFIFVGSIAISPDQQLMAYSIDFNGSEQYVIRLHDLKNNQSIGEVVENSAGNIVWHPNQTGFFYSPLSVNLRRDKIMFHSLVTDEEDKLIFHEKNPLYGLSIYPSASKEYLFINSSGHASNETYFLHKDDPNLTFNLIHKREENIFSHIDHNGDYFYKYSNQQAKNFQITRTLIDKFTPEQDWEIYIKENKEKYLDNASITQNYILLNYKYNGLNELIIADINSLEKKYVKFQDSSYVADIHSTNFEEDDIRVSYSSLARPNIEYSYNFKEDELTILKQRQIKSGFTPEDYVVERIYVPTENVKVPVSLLYKKDLFKKDGSNPLYLYGYGSYGISIPASFSNIAISLADRGFVFAIAHIRGGDDLGHDWYEDAKFLHKKRSFSDFIACAEYLSNKNYTREGNIAIAGGSAGGMLVGNVINQKPKLFKAAIAHVPFVDVLNTMLDESLPLTPGEFKEWGNPQEKKYFDYIKSYCPYQNVTKQHYPHLLVTAGLSDPRVGYWEAAKWVARLRKNKLDGNHLFLKTNMEFGHMGASGRFDYLKEQAEDLVFLAKIFELTK